MTQQTRPTTTIELELSPEEELALREAARALNTTPDAIVQQALRDMVARLDKAEAL